jgi:gluconokinase
MAKPRPEFLVLGVDIGTSSTRTALFNDAGCRLDRSLAAQRYAVDYAEDGRAELSPEAVARAVKRARNRTLRSYRSRRDFKRITIVAFAGSCLWHGLLGLDHKFRPVTPIFTWADSRAKDDAARLREKFPEEEIQQRTGCMLRSIFWPAKLLWLKRTQSKLFRQVKHWVSPSDWIFHLLFGQLRCSASMASGTGLYDLHKKNWIEELCEACGIDIATLPEIADRLDSDGRAGSHSPTVFCPIGDGAAGNFGSGADQPAFAAINIGTSAAVRVLQNAGEMAASKIPFGLFRYVADADRFIIGGAVSNAGNLRQWCLHELRLPKSSSALERALSRRLAACDRLTVLPFWVEERAPTWPEGQRGVIEGLTQATTAVEILRATETAVFYRLGQILEALESATGPMQRVIVSGGILHSRASVQLLAGAIGRDLDISSEMEASLRGAAVHALRQLGKKAKTPRSSKTVRYDRALGAKHRENRERQIILERTLRS